MTFRLDQDSDPNLPVYHQWYFEQVQDRDNLLITVGDSWTWGDSLPLDQRTQLIYGAVMAQSLDRDFVNLAICAASNIEMHDRLVKFLPKVIDHYKHITVILTLTENGREILFDPVWTDKTQRPNSLLAFQIDYERVMFETFRETLAQWPMIEFKIARNFTYTHDENLPILSRYLVHNTWVDILAQSQNMLDYPTNLRLLSQMAMTPMIAHFKRLKIYDTLRPEFFDTFMSMEEAIEWLDRSSLNSNQATRHPNELGHRLWANYLLQQIKT